ncbi:uncharacterized protein LOC128677943 isoform X1 [Plodia interpunctella]|uniref:uncharacterized protein LOC128677943 isoform X1 n=1 Tax=Plodia interpunctella TaxID=58824 RepID=UPI00236851A7|nr:uncharacterized protein LOC128677943 [Plodia interpunctella]
MRAAVILAILAVMAAIVVAEEDYAAYFKDDVKMKTAMECLLDKAPCGKLQGLRNKFPKMIKDDCGTCTPVQKTKYDVVKKLLQEHHPQYYKALKTKYST